MNLIIGILLFGLGLLTLVVWLGDMIPFFKGVLVCSLLFWGAVCLVLGVSKRKARAQLDKAKNDAPSTQEAEIGE